MSDLKNAASLVFEDINYTYPNSEQAAVRDIHIEIDPGELVDFRRRLAGQASTA